MESRELGRLAVSVAGVGCNNFGMRIDEAASNAVVDAALDAGITTFDTADLYGGGGTSEEYLGRALGARRDHAVITTKFGMLQPPEGLTGGHPQWVARAVDDSLRRLGTDRIDLYVLHQPDADTHVGDTLEALDAVIAAGKVLEIGCSNFSSSQLEEATKAAAERGVRPFVNVQNEYSLLQRRPEKNVIPYLDRHGMTLTPYFPLASGLLTGKYRRGAPPPEGTRLAAWGPRGEQMLGDDRMDLVERFDEFARAHGHSLHELALSWIASNPVVATIIAGATSPEQVRSNALATVAWKLSDAERREIDGMVPA